MDLWPTGSRDRLWFWAVSGAPSKDGLFSNGNRYARAVRPGWPKTFPASRLRVTSSERLDFADSSVDTVILKDTIHHVYGEADIHQFLTDVKRVCRKNIVSDPNPTAILLLARKLIGHRDPVCSPEQAERAISKAGFELVHKSYGEVLAFPL